MRSWGFVPALWLVILIPQAQARVFNYSDAGLAAYIRGTVGLSQLNQDAFGNSSGDATINGTTNFAYGGELGIMLGLSSKLHLRLGAEVIQHKPITNEKGTSSTGTEYFRLDSSVFAFNPGATLEYVYSVSGNLRYYAALGAGYANVTVVNNYKFTTAGTTHYGGITDYDEKMETNTISGHIETGLETLFTDNVTFMVDVGYRYLPVSNLKYKADVTSIVAPTGAAKGDTVKNADGSNRKLNLGGLFGGIAFRFYLNFL